MTRTHPAGLKTLFFAEMWERFSYYGMRALLVLYLVNHLEFPRADALAIYATYTGLVYFTPILGGYIADRWLGARRAVFVGGIVMALGHFAMAVPALLYPALGLLIVGNGFFKPNISTLVGALYPPRDARRDGGFTIFYMGINVGAFLAPFVCGTLGEKFGWHYGFAAAGVGMAFGLAVFAVGQARLGASGLPPGRAPEQTRLRQGDWRVIAAFSAAAVLLVFAVVSLWPLARGLWAGLSAFAAGSVALALALLFLMAPQFVRSRTARSTPEERKRIAAIVIVAVFVIAFWMGFEQAGGTMNLFADKLTERVMFGWEMPASWFQAINPLLIIALAPLFAMLWPRLDRSRYAPSPVVKQALGMMILGLGFVVLAIGQEHADAVGKVSPLWLVSAFALHTVGELLLSPIGLSMVTKLAPLRWVSLMMGLWFAAIATASYLAGILESLLAGSGIPLYWFLMGTSIGAGVLLLLASPSIHRLMGGVR